jgi:hypothetical protein
MQTETRNAREQLAAAADWLGWQDENMSMGLKSPADGLKLWQHWQKHQERLPEMADEDCDGADVRAERIKAIGYDPLSPARQRAALKALFA